MSNAFPRWRSLSLVMMLALALGLLLPASIGGYLLVRMNAQEAERELRADLDHYLQLLPQTLAEPVWNVDERAVNTVAEAVLNDRQLVRVTVVMRDVPQPVEVSREERRLGRQRAEARAIEYKGMPVGRVAVEIDDGLRMRQLTAQRRIFEMILAVQVLLAFVLLLVALRRHVLRPLARLAEFSDRIAGGDLETPLGWQRGDEIGRLAAQLEAMRAGLQDAFARQRAVLDNVRVGVVFVCQRRVLLANTHAEQLLGVAPGALQGATVRDFYLSTEQFEGVGARAYVAIGAGETYSEELQLRRQDGSTFWAALRGHALNAGDPHQGSIWVFDDITERRAAEEKLRLSATVFESTADGVIITDAAARIRVVNRAFCEITGYSEAEVLGQTPALLQSGRQEPAFYAGMWRQLSESGHWRGEIWNRRKNGEIYPEWLTISAVRDTLGEVMHYVGVFSDITTIKRSAEQLDYLAHHDHLTGLPNRLLALDRLAHALRRTEREGGRVGVMFIDLDNFKTVNETLGHHRGDDLLRQAAARLGELLRLTDTLARFGGDEFLVIVEASTIEVDTVQVAERVMQALSRPFWITGTELFISGSIGIAVSPHDGTEAETLVRNADAALYKAKQSGRNGFRFYTAEMTALADQRMRLETQLRHAVARDELRLVLQPQVDMVERRLTGAEALVRWQHPELGLMSPDSFIPLAEDSGFIHELGDWVLREACRQWLALAAQGLRLPKISANVSPRQFERGGVVERVAAALRDTGMPPAALQLEITESVAMDPDGAQALHRLRELGVELAIDDFGTGYSSLAYLKHMPVQMLKIDRSFIRDIAADPDDAAITSAIIQMAKTLGMQVIAEGVEAADHVDFLVERGCHLAQGYYYGRPVPAAELLTAWKKD